MSYEEQVINNVLCWRPSPQYGWVAFSAENLTQMLLALRAEKVAPRVTELHPPFPGYPVYPQPWTPVTPNPLGPPWIVCSTATAQSETSLRYSNDYSKTVRAVN